uniref:REJ domain-containing protein n=1 Tax=Anopheles coluzzii TaxID=1518534 RepID=A0A8W7PHF2_ANOCL
MRSCTSYRWLVFSISSCCCSTICRCSSSNFLRSSSYSASRWFVFDSLSVLPDRSACSSCLTRSMSWSFSLSRLRSVSICSPHSRLRFDSFSSSISISVSCVSVMLHAPFSMLNFSSSICARARHSISSVFSASRSFSELLHSSRSFLSSSFSTDRSARRSSICLSLLAIVSCCCFILNSSSSFSCRTRVTRSSDCSMRRVRMLFSPRSASSSFSSFHSDRLAVRADCLSSMACSRMADSLSSKHSFCFSSSVSAPDNPVPLAFSCAITFSSRSTTSSRFSARLRCSFSPSLSLRSCASTLGPEMMVVMSCRLELALRNSCSYTSELRRLLSTLLITDTDVIFSSCSLLISLRRWSFFFCISSLIFSENCFASRSMLFSSSCIVIRRLMLSTSFCSRSATNFTFDSSSCSRSRSSRTSASSPARCSFSAFHFVFSSAILASSVDSSRSLSLAPASSVFFSASCRSYAWSEACFAFSHFLYVCFTTSAIVASFLRRSSFSIFKPLRNVLFSVRVAASSAVFSFSSSFMRSSSFFVSSSILLCAVMETILRSRSSTSFCSRWISPLCSFKRRSCSFTFAASRAAFMCSSVSRYTAVESGSSYT